MGLFVQQLVRLASNNKPLISFKCYRQSERLISPFENKVTGGYCSFLVDRFSLGFSLRAGRPARAARRDSEPLFFSPAGRKTRNDWRRLINLVRK